MKMARRLMSRKDLRDEFRDEMKNMASHLMLINRASQISLSRAKGVWLRVLYFISRPVAFLRSQGRIRGQLRYLAVQIRCSVREMEVDHMLMEGSSPERGIRVYFNIDEMEKIGRWAAKASLWAESEFYPRSPTDIGLKDALPLFSPSWMRQNWRRR